MARPQVVESEGVRTEPFEGELRAPPSTIAGQLLTLLREERCNVATAARRLGMRSRFELSHRLRAEGSPPFRTLRCWVQVESWLYEMRRSNQSLASIALHYGEEPSARYRLVRAVTGLTWGELTSQGMDHLQAIFSARFRQRASCPPPPRRRLLEGVGRFLVIRRGPESGARPFGKDGLATPWSRFFIDPRLTSG